MPRRGTRFLALFTAIAAMLLTVPASAGAGSAHVAALQVAMRALGLYPHPVDGITGPWTQQAVRTFQAQHKLTVDGIAGRQTRAALGKRGKPNLGARPMRRGQRGWDVAALQFLLHERGFEPGGFDGGFGPKTENAVRRFQSAAHLRVDGVAGPATLNALRGTRVVTAGPIGEGHPHVAGVGPCDIGDFGVALERRRGVSGEIGAQQLLQLWLVEHVGWPSIFYINLPLVAAAILVALTRVDESREPEKAKDFYRAVLGWDGETHPFGPSEYTEWELGGETFGGMKRMNEDFPSELPAHWTMYVAVEDCDAAAARVTELGGSVGVQPTTIPPGRFAVVLDPQGGYLSLITRSEAR